MSVPNGCRNHSHLCLLQAAMSRAVPPEQIQQLLDMLLQRDLQPLLQQQQQQQLGQEGQQFVAGRALWVGGKLCQVATEQQRDALLRAAAAAGRVWACHIHQSLMLVMLSSHWHRILLLAAGMAIAKFCMMLGGR